MITDRNKLNFVTIQWLWFLCLILACSSSTWIHNVDATQQQQQQQQKLLHQQQQQQLKSTLQFQQEVESNVPIQKQHQQQQHQQQQQQDVTVRNFSPRMDYNNNEWRPVGRGDPLKNDPTFDYSPPTLDRVRYWADPDKEKEKLEEVAAALVDAKLKKANPGKNEILLLGVTGDRDRMRGTAAGNLLKNSKGETPLLQPKYTSIRRSYYAHQLPTHLMPPPMQPMQPGTQQQQLQPSSSLMAKPMHSEYHHHPQQLQSPSSAHMIKPVHTEYRHSMAGHSYMTSSPLSSMAMHSKPYYMSTATQPWVHTSSSPSMTTHSGHLMSGNSQRYAHPHDSHYQESHNYLSYNSRPSMSSTPSIMMINGQGHHDIYSPNSIRGSSGLHKPSVSSRKPWIHDLLQKEFIKPVKPTISPNSYHSETLKPLPHMESHFEPMLPPKGISTTYSPVTFVTPTMPTSTTQTVYITSTSYQSSTPSTTTTTTAPSYSHYPSYSTPAPRTTTTLTPNRLLIPNTSNLAYRPTVTPMKMTTDSLFSHYNQPEKPLRGPMYLIIEGHSKVKTYGKDELDPHKPKIVPIIPKREPVVRIADPNEKRGTPETFQVKHLHTKTTAIMETTTSKPTTTTSTTTSTTTTTTTTTTKKPELKTSKSTTTPKPSSTKTTPKVSSTTTTTKKSSITKMAPKLSVTTTSKTLTDKFSMNNEKISNKDIKNSSKVEKSVMDIKMSSKTYPHNPNSLDTAEKPSPAMVTEPPTGMEGLLSFLGSSLDNIFKDDTLNPSSSSIDQDKKELTTKLKPIQMNSQPQIESRVSTKLEAIKAEDYDDVNEQYFKVTTEYLPRETRQIFDYDQLPESRIQSKDGSNYDEFEEQLNDEDDLSTFNLDDEYEEDEEGEDQHSLIKRIDSLVSSPEEDFDDISALEDGVDLTDIATEDLEALAEARHRQQAKKA